MFSKEDLVENYENVLNVNYPEHVKRFRKQLRAEPESARAEAVVFSFLKENTTDVKVEEHLVKGGVDFRCQKDDSEFVVEVTCLTRESVSCASGLSDEVPQPRTVGSYERIPQRLMQEAVNKASQMSGYNCPRVLIITSEHLHADLVFDSLSASYLLTGKPLIAIHSPILITELKESVFFRLNKKGELESCRKSISAILLFSVTGSSASVVGLLHPDPAHKFPPQLLSSVPFIGMKEYPPENGRILTEWQNQETPEPRPYIFWYGE